MLFHFDFWLYFIFKRNKQICNFHYAAMSMVTPKTKTKNKKTKVLIPLVLMPLIFSSNKKILYFKKDFTLKITLWQKKIFLAEVTFKFVFFNSCIFFVVICLWKLSSELRSSLSRITNSHKVFCRHRWKLAMIVQNRSYFHILLLLQN